MKHTVCVLLFFALCANVFAQFKVQFIAEELSVQKHDTIYITGNFNNWDTANKNYKLNKFNAHQKAITLNLPEGKCEYKFTHGTWLTIEKDIECGEIENRLAYIKKDTTIYVTIENWKDICISENLSLAQLRDKLTHEVNDSVRVRLLIQMSFQTGDDDSLTLVYAQQALALSVKIKYKRGVADAYRQIGRIYANKGKYSEGRKYWFASLRLYNELQARLRAQYVTDEIGTSYKSESNYDEALKFFYASLASYEKIGDKTSVARSLESIAEVYAFQGNNIEALKKYKEAILSFQESWELYKEDWMRSAVARCFTIIGIIHGKQASYSEAMYNDSIGISMYREMKDDWGLSYALSSMGNICKKQALLAADQGNKLLASAKIKQALKFLEESLKLNEFYGAYITLGSIYIYLNDFRKAKKYINRSLELSQSMRYKEGLKLSMMTMAELDSAQGNFKLAYEHYKMYIVYRDSMVNEESAKKSERYKNAYELDKKEGQIKLLSTQNKLQTALAQQQTQHKNFAYTSLGIILLAGGYGFYRFRKRKRLQNQQALMNERLRISRELHDEVGATLSGIAMYSHLTKEQIKSANTTEVEKSLNIMQQSAGEMVNKLNDIVWLVNPDQDSLQKLIQRLEEYARDMAAIKNMQVKVNVPEHLQENGLPMESRRNIYLFCKEAINNAVKYSNGTLLELNIKEFDNKLEFSVSDNGKGFDAVMVRRGNGLENMQKRADEIGAKLSLQSKREEGCFVSMQVKIT